MDVASFPNSYDHVVEIQTGDWRKERIMCLRILRIKTLISIHLWGCPLDGCHVYKIYPWLVQHFFDHTKKPSQWYNYRYFLHFVIRNHFKVLRQALACTKCMKLWYYNILDIEETFILIHNMKFGSKAKEGFERFIRKSQNSSPLFFTYLLERNDNDELRSSISRFNDTSRNIGRRQSSMDKRITNDSLGTFDQHLITNDASNIFDHHLNTP